MPALRAAVPTDELFALDMALRASVPPPVMADVMRFMLPAMNVDERADMVGGMSMAPPEVFAVLPRRGRVRPVGRRLGPARRPPRPALTTAARTTRRTNNTTTNGSTMTTTTTRIGLALPQIGALADPARHRRGRHAPPTRLGYASLWAMDRLLAPLAPRTPYPASPDGELPPEQRITLDPIGALTLAAAVTERVRLGTSVLVAPWYPPVLLARALTTLDHISAGRLTVGLGLGWSVDEYEAVGVPQRRLAGHSEEVLDVLEAIWTDRHRRAPRRAVPHRPVDDPAQAGAASAPADPARRLHAGRARPGRPPGRRVDAGRAAGRRRRPDVRRRARPGGRPRPRPRRHRAGRAGQHQGHAGAARTPTARPTGDRSTRSPPTSTPPGPPAPTRSSSTCSPTPAPPASCSSWPPP